MKTITFIQGASVALCVVALAAYVFVFELRYNWYLGPHDYLVVRAIETITALAILVVWIAYPVVWIGMAVCALGFILPTLLVPKIFVRLDFPFLPFIVGCCAIVGLSIFLRSRGPSH